jgi:4-hydroxybenzoate polyprenyltransferase
MFLAFSYPFMKRITYWPQLFLGLTFTWGLIMSWTAFNNLISLDIFLFYISAIFWTLGYDTIYGAQDMSEDEIIGLKSTSITFKNNIKFFVSISYFLFAFIILCLFRNYIGLNTFTTFLTLFFGSLIYQILIFNKDNPTICLKIFKSNNLSGFFFIFSNFIVSLVL